MSDFESETDLTRFRDVTAADVYKDGRLAARLLRSSGQVTFTYDPEYLADESSIAVATSLPKTDTPTVTYAGALPPFFSGLLPEGRRFGMLQRAVKTSADDELSMLLAVGADVAGDVQIVPEGALPTRNTPALNVETWDGILFSKLFDDPARVDRSALAGVQDKVSGRMMTVPIFKGNAPFILKINPPEYAHVVENEAFFLQWARNAGIPTSNSSLVRDGEGKAGLVVERFDRTMRRTKLRAIGVEDACQVLNMYPGDKYNVSMEELVVRVSRECRASQLAALELFRLICFAILTGNNDQHAKNLSIVWREDEWRVSPAYDLPNTTLYGDKFTALKILGKNRGHSRKNLLALAENVGLRSAAAEKVLADILDRTQHLIDSVSDDVLPFADNALHDLINELRYRRKLLVRNSE